MNWPLVYLIAACVLIADVLFAVLAHRHEQAVHDREAAFRPRDDQSNNVSNQSHVGLHRSKAEQDHAA